jgi:hypothetical protein
MIGFRPTVLPVIRASSRAFLSGEMVTGDKPVDVELIVLEGVCGQREMRNRQQTGPGDFL